MKLLQVNTTLISSATGNIAFQIGQLSIANGDESFIAFSGRYPENKKTINSIRVGSKLDFYWHALITRIFDRHGFGSIRATKKLIKKINVIKPDIIHIHNIHGYYLNIEVLFNYLAAAQIPVVWTLHDCWSLTGHCDHFEHVECNKWQTGCHTCPQKKLYPASLIVDNSKANYIDKNRLFNSVDNLTLVPVSNWLNSKLKYSFLKKYSSKVIQNGIDLEVFQPSSKNVLVKNFSQHKKFILLGVASIWTEKKGFYEFIKLSKNLDDNFVIVLVGVSQKMKKILPKNIISINRTSNQQELANIYSSADLYLNLTFEDSYPTTNLESIACGTPILTYKTGGSIESVIQDSGIIVNRGDIESLVEKIQEIRSGILPTLSSQDLRMIAIENFDKNINFEKYINLYRDILGISR